MSKYLEMDITSIHELLVNKKIKPIDLQELVIMKLELLLQLIMKEQENKL